MTVPWWWVPPAFQLWDALGWAGQALFTLRFLHQWVASERARRSHVTTTFWWISLAATALLLVYALYRRDPVFVSGLLVNLFLNARNLQIALRGESAGRRRSPLPALLAGLLLFGGVTVVSVASRRDLVSFDHPLPWLIVGFTGQVLWTSRFLVQWFVSERLGRSVLPASFFWMSLVGAPILFAWAVYRLDWVMMAAYALNPIPYVRNLVLLARERRAAA
jgi:lipid-A-disaccharide synthase-like uncharacterized protein